MNAVLPLKEEKGLHVANGSNETDSLQRPESPTTFFSHALSIDKKGKTLLDTMELYYPADTVTVAAATPKPNRAILKPGLQAMQYIAKGESNQAGKARPQPRVDLPPIEESLPSKRKRQPKFDDDSTYYQSPINKRPKSAAMDSLALLTEKTRNIESEDSKNEIPIGPAVTPQSERSTLRLKSVNITKKLMQCGVTEGEICDMVSVNKPVLQKWLDNSTDDVNPSIIRRLTESVGNWLSTLATDDIDTLMSDTLSRIPNEILQKLFPLREIESSTNEAQDEEPFQYNSVEFLLKHNLRLRADVSIT